MTRVALVCPGKPIRRERADAVLALAAAEFPHIELAFCLLYTSPSPRD